MVRQVKPIKTISLRQKSSILNTKGLPHLRTCTYNDKLKSILNEVIHGIVLIDENCMVREINEPALRMLGNTEDEIVGKSLPSLATKECQKDLLSYLKECRKNEAKTVAIEEFDFKRQTTLQLDFNHFFRNSENGLVYSIGLVYDVTDRSKLEDEVAFQKKSKKNIQEKLDKELELSDMKSRFISIASHEFRTPLAGILSSIDLAERYVKAEKDKWDNFDNKTKVESHFSSIKRSVSHLTVTLNQFLSISKLEEGEIENKPTQINLRKSLGSQIREFKNLKKKGQSIEFEFIGEKTHVFLDENILRNVFNNLLSNAIKYTSEGKKIKIIAEVDSKEIRVSIKDEGCGIPEAEQKNMFRRFFRAKNVVNIQGTGLGLNIVRRYLEIMNGKITFESKENVGTTFYLTFEINA